MKYFCRESLSHVCNTEICFSLELKTAFLDEIYNLSLVIHSNSLIPIFNYFQISVIWVFDVFWFLSNFEY